MVRSSALLSVIAAHSPAGQWNRTIKEATVKRYHYEDHDQLRTHLTDFINAYNYARRLKMLKGLTPYEYICKTWTKEPEKFILNPTHQMPGLNNWIILQSFLHGLCNLLGVVNLALSR